MTPDEHRAAVQAAKVARNDAMRENAAAENDGRPAVHDVEALRRRVHETAKAARLAGVDLSGLVGDSVGVGEYGTAP